MELYRHSPSAQRTVALLQRKSPCVAKRPLSGQQILCMKFRTADLTSCCAQYCYSNANITVTKHSLHAVLSCPRPATSEEGDGS